MNVVCGICNKWAASESELEHEPYCSEVRKGIRRATLDEAIKRVEEDTTFFRCDDGRYRAAELLRQMRDE